jgi:hypothetical protein
VHSGSQNPYRRPETHPDSAISMPETVFISAVHAGDRAGIRAARPRSAFQAPPSPSFVD